LTRVKVTRRTCVDPLDGVSFLEWNATADAHDRVPGVEQLDDLPVSNGLFGTAHQLAGTGASSPQELDSIADGRGVVRQPDVRLGAVDLHQDLPA